MANRVIVVGAGPVGLMLAGELRLGGVDVVVYDLLPTPTGESRALGFTRRTAEVLDQRGLLARLGEFRQGRGVPVAGVHIDASMVDDDHFGVMGLPQSRTEAMLTDWATELGASVRRGCEVVGFRETADGVVVALDGPAGREEDTADYVVGCDGPQSVVRQSAGIEFPGEPATRGMYLADVAGAVIRPRPVGEAVVGGMVVSVPLGGGVDRIVVTEEDLRPPHVNRTVTAAELADTWQRMTGESIHQAEFRWIAALSNETGLATEYRRGRAFVAGEAAHNHHPLAALGISVGIQDAVNLGWKLAATINGWAPAGLLDTYHSERHPVGAQLLGTVATYPLVFISGPEMEPVRSLMRELVRLRSAAEHLAGLVSGVTVRYDVGATGHPSLGRRLSPDHEIQVEGGTRVRVADLLRSARGLLVVTGGPDGAAGRAAGWADRVDVVAGAWVRAAEPDGSALPAAALVRPDGHVVWAAPGGGDLDDALERWFGAAGARRPAGAAELARARS